MKIKHALCILVLVVCWKPFANTFAGEKGNNIKVEMRVFSDKDIFTENDVMPIWLQIENKSRESYYLLDGDDELGAINFFSVLNQHGGKVPYSIQMRRRLDPYSVRIRRGGRPLKIEIPPGTSKKIEVTSNLFKSIDIQQSGEYRYLPTIFIQDENGLNVNVERVPPLNFSVTENAKTHNNAKKTAREFTDINVPPQSPVYGLQIKKIRISKNIWKEEPAEYWPDGRAELIVEVENVSTDKFPAVQWFGSFDMALWDCKVIHNKQTMKYDFHFFSSNNNIRYHYWYDIIKPGDSRSFKLILNPCCFPSDIPKGAKEVDINGVWDFILSRKIYLAKDGKYNTMSDSELAKCEKQLSLPKISITIKGWSKLKLPVVLKSGSVHRE